MGLIKGAMSASSESESEASEADAMEVDEYGRVQGEAHTSGALEFGAAASLLSSEASASSLFTLQQLLQRDDCGAIGEALSTFAFRVLRREAAAVVVADAWVAASPTLGEVFRAFRLRGGHMDDAKTLGCFRALGALLPRLDAPEAGAVWFACARDWGPQIQKCLRRTHVALRHAALHLLEACVVHVRAPAARVALRWIDDEDETWAALCKSFGRSAAKLQTRGNPNAKRGKGRGGGGEGEGERKGASTRQLCVRLCAGVLKFGDSEAREAACREGGVARTVVGGLGDDPRGFRPPVSGVPAKLEDSRARSHRSRFGRFFDESMALVEFSKHGQRVWSKPRPLKIWNPRRRRRAAERKALLGVARRAARGPRPVRGQRRGVPRGRREPAGPGGPGPGRAQRRRGRQGLRQGRAAMASGGAAPSLQFVEKKDLPREKKAPRFDDRSVQRVEWTPAAGEKVSHPFGG